MCSDYILRLRERQQEYLRLGVDLMNPVKLIDTIIKEIETLGDFSLEQPLTLSQAAAESGYSIDHLARLVRQQIIPNAGRKRSPRILRRNLPRRPKQSLASRITGRYDLEADVRSVRSRLHRGGSHGD